MSNKVFVGGLSWNIDNDGLRVGFEKFGAVRDAKVIMDRDTGRSRGFGFVTFEEDRSVGTAIDGMDGQEMDGRTVRVSEAEERSPRR